MPPPQPLMGRGATHCSYSVLFVLHALSVVRRGEGWHILFFIWIDEVGLAWGITLSTSPALDPSMNFYLSWYIYKSRQYTQSDFFLTSCRPYLNTRNIYRTFINIYPKEGFTILTRTFNKELIVFTVAFHTFITVLCIWNKG